MVLKFAFLIWIALAAAGAQDRGWTSLFNGKDLTGWKPNENIQTFSVRDGAIVAHGERSHCFYVGGFNKHAFKDFELMVEDVSADLAQDNEWFTEHIVAHGNTITIFVNDKQVVKWTQPADWNGTKDFSGRRIGAGTIALQGHDPGSTVYYKNIRIRILE